MKKTETTKLLNKIKGYYNSQFFIDDFVLDAWAETLEPYDFEDAEEHIKEYLKEYPDIAPKPHTFIKGMLTKEQKEARKNSGYLVSCNLCGKWMSLQEYDDHYGRCLDIQYLLSVAKQKGEEYTREDLEQCKPEVIDKLLNKYPPKKVDWYGTGSA
jgi:hypothetical protein